MIRHDKNKFYGQDKNCRKAIWGDLSSTESTVLSTTRSLEPSPGHHRQGALNLLSWKWKRHEQASYWDKYGQMMTYVPFCNQKHFLQKVWVFYRKTLPHPQIVDHLPTNMCTSTICVCVCVFYHVLPYIVCVAHERVHLVHIHELHKVHVSINIASFFTMHRAPQRSCCWSQICRWSVHTKGSEDSAGAGCYQRESSKTRTDRFHLLKVKPKTN